MLLDVRVRYTRGTSLIEQSAETTMNRQTFVRTAPDLRHAEVGTARTVTALSILNAANA